MTLWYFRFLWAARDGKVKSGLTPLELGNCEEALVVPLYQIPLICWIIDILVKTSIEWRWRKVRNSNHF